MAKRKVAKPYLSEAAPLTEGQRELAHWAEEFESARNALKQWHEDTRKIDEIIRDEDLQPQARANKSRWNVYAAGVDRKRALLFSGQTPRVDLARRFGDSGDDVARVAAEAAERLLNTDIERGSDGCVTAARDGLADRLGAPGFALMRVRYVAEYETQTVAEVPAILDEATGAEQAPAVPEQQKQIKKFEEAETDFVHFDNQLWSSARRFKEWRWWAECIPMSTKAMAARWGDKAKGAPLNYQRQPDDKKDEGSEAGKRAAVWEVWDKDTKQVHWLIEGFAVLETQADPFGLPGFFPFAAPMAAGLTNTKYIPKSDYKKAQDLYLELDEICLRIKQVSRSIKVKGGYPRVLGEDFTKLLDEADANELIPFDHWEMFAERGGIEKAILWLPIDKLIVVLAQLKDHRRELIDAIYQLTGDSDIMRGEATQAGATATEQRAKVKFGGAHLQALQDDFARWMAEHQQIRLHVACRDFDRETIMERANLKFTEDARNNKLINDALDLLKSGKTDYRIALKAESVSLTDFAAMKDERLEFLDTLGGLVQRFAPMMQILPPQVAQPLLIESIKFAVSGLRGAGTFEGVLDQALQAMQQAAQQPQQQAPDPKMQVEQMKLQGSQMKAQADVAKEQVKHQNRMAELQAEVQADSARENDQRIQNTREAADKMLIARALKPQPMMPGGLIE